MLGFRSRDQVWQLGLVAGAASLVLVLAGILALGGDAEPTEAAGGFTVADEPAGGITAEDEAPSGPSSSDDAGRRSGAAPNDDGGTGDGTASTTGTEAPTTVTTTATTEAPTTVIETTVATTAPPTTETPTTEPSTTETPVTEPPTTEPEETTTTEPVITVLPPVTGPTPDHSAVARDLASARERWRSMGFDSYAMTVTRTCFCAPNSTGPFDLVVRGGAVQSIRSRTGQGVSETLDPQSLTVPGLFALIESAIDDADGLTVGFDPTTGVPLAINIDYARLAVDDELAVSVEGFQPHRAG